MLDKKIKEHYHSIKKLHADRFVFIACDEIYHTFDADSKVLHNLLPDIPYENCHSAMSQSTFESCLPKLIRAGHLIAISCYLRPKKYATPTMRAFALQA